MCPHLDQGLAGPITAPLQAAHEPSSCWIFPTLVIHPVPWHHLARVLTGTFSQHAILQLRNPVGSFWTISACQYGRLNYCRVCTSSQLYQPASKMRVKRFAMGEDTFLHRSAARRVYMHKTIKKTIRICMYLSIDFGMDFKDKMLTKTNQKSAQILIFVGAVFWYNYGTSFGHFWRSLTLKNRALACTRCYFHVFPMFEKVMIFIDLSLPNPPKMSSKTLPRRPETARNSPTLPVGGVWGPSRSKVLKRS